MSKIKLAKAREIFCACLKCGSTEERHELLTRQAAGDADLEAAVRELLDAHEANDSFLEHPLGKLLGGDPEAEIVPTQLSFELESADMTVGSYKLREQIGEGGFGVVYVAEQMEPVQRKVALKIIKPGMDTKEVIGRFQAEQQALAMMDHPNIAKVFDAGTTETGRPYFVMELIRGMPITQFCREKMLDLPGRLKLFIDVSKAVQHAHQKGVIHRDIKPSNVMITLHDGRPVVKVIDFGVAKALSQKLTEETIYTRHAQMIGTPTYMSPEQAELSGLDIDTRSDVYSLGVLLYETLTGATPFDQEALLSKGFDEMRRIIREDDPPRPSYRVSTLDAEALSTMVQERGLDSRDYSRVLKRELDWIVMKALEKDRERRYESANDLAADVQRYLDDGPVLACPPTLAYRLRKSLKRQKGLFASVCLILLTALVGMGVSLKYATDANDFAEAAGRAQKEAEENAAEAEESATEAKASEKVAQEANARTQVSLYTANMRLASDALIKGDVLRAGELLAKYVGGASGSALRGFEWHYFLKLVSQPCLKTIQQVGWVEDVELSPDGRWLATTSSGRVIVYEATTWNHERTYPVLTESINGLAWSQDGQMLAAACANGQIHVWNFVADSHKAWFPAHEGEANDVVFTADGKELISCGDDNLAKRWDIASLKLRVSYEGHQREVDRIALSPDGRLLATASSDQSFAVWNVTTAEKVQSFAEEEGRIICVAFSANGQLVAAGNINGYLYLMNVNTGETRLMTKQVDGIEALTFFGRDRWFATADRGGAIQLHPVSDEPASEGIPGSRWMSHNGRAISLTTTRNGKGLISGGRDGAIHLWQPDIDHTRWALYNANGYDDFAIADNHLYRAGYKIEVWDLETRRLIDSFAPADPEWGYIALSADERFLAAFRVGELILFDRDSQKPVRTWKVPRHWKPHRLAISPNGNDVAIAESSERESIFLFGKDGGPEPRVLPAQQCNNLMFSPDGLWLAAGRMDDLRLFDLKREFAYHDFRGHSSSLTGVKFTPDSRHLATVSDDRLLKLWSIETGKEVYSIAAHRDAVRGVAITPDGRTIATTGDDHAIRFWHTTTGQPLGGLRVRWAFWKILFSDDGLKLIAQKHGAAVVYDATPRRPADLDPIQDEKGPLFVGLGDLPGGPFQGVAQGLSANGRFVVGHGYVADGQHNPFIWSLETGMLSYDVDRSESHSKAAASGVSDDGSRVCGSGLRSPAGARLWTSLSESQPVASGISWAEAMTPDGSVIVGKDFGKYGWKAFRWENGTTVFLTESPAHRHAQAIDVTPDDQFILGRVFNGKKSSVYWELDDSVALQDCQPVLWTKDGLQFLPGFDAKSNWWPTGISDDGTVIVGVFWPVGEMYGTAFVWENGTIKFQGSLPGYPRSIAKAVSGDGSIVVGRCFATEEKESWDDSAFIWYEHIGIRPLAEELASKGCRPGGWRVHGCKAISQDGSVFVGDGHNPNGQREAWYARLPRSTEQQRVKSSLVQPTRARFLKSEESPSTSFVTLGFQVTQPNLTNDGNSVVGNMTYGGKARSFLWNRNQGLRVLPLPAGFTTSQSTIIDPQGTRIAARISGPDKPQSVVIWSGDGTDPTVIEPLGDWRRFFPNGAHVDVIVGWGAVGDPLICHAWCFQRGKLQKLPSPKSTKHVGAKIVSADGSTIVGFGWSRSATYRRRIVADWRMLRWRDDQLEELSGFPKEYHFLPNDLSADGSVIVGHCWREGTDPRSDASWPFRWENGQVEIFDVRSNSTGFGAAETVTNDGQVVFIQGVEHEIPTAFLWDKTHGLRRLADVFQAAGGELHGWRLENATSISGDGTFIAGDARHPDGRREAYVLRLPPHILTAPTENAPAKAEKREENPMP